MKRARPLLAAFGLVLVTACIRSNPSDRTRANAALPPPRVVPAGTIRNVGVLLYAFGEPPLFRVESLPVDVDILAPVTSIQTEEAETGLHATHAGAGMTQAPARSESVTEDHAGSARVESLAGSAGARDDAAQTREEEAAAMSRARADESTRETAENAGKRTESEAAAALAAKEAAAARQASDASASLATHTDEGAMVTTPLAARIDGVTTQAVCLAAAAGASMQAAARAPVIHKRATRNRVLVGNRFAFIVELRNDTPLDLRAAELEDRLDPRLRLVLSDLRITPAVRFEPLMEGGVLRIRFPTGIKSGQALKIVIPVTLVSARQPNASVP